MEPGDRPASDGHKKKRKQRALDDRAAAVDVLREIRKPNVRMNYEDANYQHRDRPQLHIGREVIARSQHQPHRKHRSDQAINGHQDRDLMRSEGQRAGYAALREPPSPDHAGDQQRNSKNAWSQDRDFSRLALEHPEAHDHGDRDRHANREHPPRAVRKRVDDNNAQARQGDDKNKEDCNHRDQAGKGTDFSSRNVGQRAATMAHRSDQHGEILHAARENGADQYPKEAGSESKLRRQRGSNQRPRSGNRGEMMAEQNPSRGNDIVVAVGIKMSGRSAAIVESHRLGGDERTVITIGQRVDTERT